jgi:peptidoglycan hydrolase-like protein with peptidoglycan-binding domain
MRYFKILFLLIIAMIILTFTSVSYAETSFTEGSIDIGGTKLYLRATEDSPVVYELEEGSRIGVYSEDGDYARVVFGNYRGYVKRDHIFVPTEDAYEASVYSNGLRVRMSPGEYSTIITQLKEDTKIQIVDVYGNWYKIKVAAEDNDTKVAISGFVANEYVLITDDAQADLMLRPGMSGSRVKTLQKELKARRFLSASATGYYGPATKQAVGNFQVAAALSPDGIAGKDTLKILYADNNIKAPRVSSGSSSSGSSSGSSGGGSGYRINFSTSNGTTSALASIGKVHSIHYSKAYGVFPVGSSAKITIVATGTSFNVKRNVGRQGSPHADVEPKTSSDSATLKSALGGSFVSARCPVWITMGGATYAASIYSVPHAEDLAKIGGNSFPGVMCVWFTDSRGNSSNATDSNHQAAVSFAYNAAKG